jgi:F-type H+-transporting ATPase subunit a
MTKFRTFLTAFLLFGLCAFVSAQQEDHSGHPQDHPAKTEHPTGEQPAVPQVHDPAHPTVHTNEAPHGAAGHDEHGACGHMVGGHADGEFNAGDLAVHHIADANAIHIFGDIYFHLPCFLYAPGHGFTFTHTGAFKPEHHGNGTIAKNGYVLVEGNVLHVADPTFPQGDVAVGPPTEMEEKDAKGKTKIKYYTSYNGQCYPLDKKTSFDGGIMGGGITSFYDFSITRNVFTMLLVFGLLFFMLRSVAKAYTRRPGQAPTGLQNFIEPIITFVRDEVAKPNIGAKYERYMPFLLSAFFFILGLNLIGQIPFFPGGGNVTGSISVTIVLALLTFFITNFSGNKHYWEHTLWMPGVPAWLKIFILTPVEVLGLFLRPFTLLLRLFANITAGHIVIISFVSLIFIFGKAGQSASGSAVGAAAAIPLTLFMMTLELLVAFLQAFIFTMLSAVYIGSAVEEAHH